MLVKQIIFDLDGTLIDSSASILAAFKGAFDSLGISPMRSLTADIIGPPLREALQLLSGVDDVAVLDSLAAAFKEHYDTAGYRQTTVFTGVPEMLEALSAMPLDLYIATNKRIKPTLLILEYLGWMHYFKGVYALDSLNPPAKNKVELLASIMCKYAMGFRDTYYVGDRMDDWAAASKNSLHFAWAHWGYDAQPLKNEALNIYARPIDLLAIACCNQNPAK